MRFFFSSRRRHTRCSRDWSSDVCSSDLTANRTHVSSGSPTITNRHSAAPVTETTHTNGTRNGRGRSRSRSEEHTSELQSRLHLVCRLLLEKKKKTEYVAKGKQDSKHEVCPE